MIKLNGKEVFNTINLINLEGQTTFKIDKDLLLSPEFHIELFWENNDDLIKLMMLKDCLDTECPNKLQELYIKYFPIYTVVHNHSQYVEEENKAKKEISININKFIFDFIRKMNFDRKNIFDN